MSNILITIVAGVVLFFLILGVLLHVKFIDLSKQFKLKENRNLYMLFKVREQVQGLPAPYQKSLWITSFAIILFFAFLATKLLFFDEV